MKGRIGVGTLMTIAAVGAVVLGELGEAASLAFLFSISEALEGYAMARTRRGLRALLALVPDRVTVRRGGTEIGIDPAELVVGDVMITRPGGRLATDGVVRVGRSTLDLSAITGESVPVEVEAGQQVFAASINGGGVLEIEVTAPTSDSSLARVVHIVEEAQERKGTSQRLAERIAQPLVPAIMVVAAAIAVVGSLLGDPALWVGRALVVLVAAAPCAFAISVPVTVVTAVGAAAKMGALIKGGAALEALADIDVVALDKTGPGEAHDVQAVAGHGLTGTIDRRPARLGSANPASCSQGSSSPPSKATRPTGRPSSSSSATVASSVRSPSATSSDPRPAPWWPTSADSASTVSSC